MSFTVRNIFIAAVVLLSVGLAYAFVQQSYGYGYGFKPRWHAECRSTDLVLCLLGATPLPASHDAPVFRLTVSTAFGNSVSYLLSGGQEPSIRVTGYNGTMLNTEPVFSIHRPVSAQNFDIFLRNLYATGIFDQQPDARTSIDDGTWIALEARVGDSYLGFGSNDPESVMPTISRYFADLCGASCGQARYHESASNKRLQRTQQGDYQTCMRKFAAAQSGR